MCRSAAEIPFFAVVRFSHPDPEFAEIEGLTGYVCGKGEVDDGEVAVFFYEIERVWCVPAGHCVELGHLDEEAAARNAETERGLAVKGR